MLAHRLTPAPPATTTKFLVNKELRELGLQCGLRSPTYTTAGGGSSGADADGYGHASGIVSVVAIPVHKGGMDGVGAGEMLALGDATSFQVMRAAGLVARTKYSVYKYDPDSMKPVAACLSSRAPQG